MKVFLRGRYERKVETYNKPCEILSGRKNVSTACRKERLEEQVTTEIGRELNRATEEGIINREDFKRREVRQEGRDSIKELRKEELRSNEKTQEKERGCAEREDHRRAESPIAEWQLATATPGQSWPADGDQHIDVVHLTTADVQNSSSYRLLEAVAILWQIAAVVSCWEHASQTGAANTGRTRLQHSRLTLLSNAYHRDLLGTNKLINTKNYWK